MFKLAVGVAIGIKIAPYANRRYLNYAISYVLVEDHVGKARKKLEDVFGPRNR